jgi:hypothetical protein
VACFAVGSFAAPASADSLIIKVKPNTPVVKRVVITNRKPCYIRTVKTVTNRKTVIVKKRVCP